MAKSTSPVLSLTESSARVIFRVSMLSSRPFRPRWDRPRDDGSRPASSPVRSIFHTIRTSRASPIMPLNTTCEVRCGPALIGEQHALLDRRLLGVRADAPGLAVAQDQRHGAAVAGDLRLHARMEMKADGVCAGDQPVGALQAAGGELVLTRNEIAGRLHQNLPRVADAIAVQIAVMGALDAQIVALVREGALRIERSDQRGIGRGLIAIGRGRELGERILLETQRGMGRRRAGEQPPLFVVGGRRPAIDDHGSVARTHLEGQEPGMGLGGERGDRRRSEIADDERRAAFEPHIAGVRGGAHGRAFDVVIGEHGGERVGRRRTGAVEARHGAVGAPEEAQHRHDAVDGVGELFRRCPVARHETLPQRQAGRAAARSALRGSAKYARHRAEPAGRAPCRRAGCSGRPLPAARRCKALHRAAP